MPLKNWLDYFAMSDIFCDPSYCSTKRFCEDTAYCRSIASIPVDVKVLIKVLTCRLQAVIPDLVHDDQKGFTKGRSIHNHARFAANELADRGGILSTSNIS